jgi:hypothetical protein
MRSRQDDATLDCAVLSAANLAEMQLGIVPNQNSMCFADCCTANGPAQLRPEFLM